MLNVEGFNDDENAGYNTVINGMNNSIEKDKEYEKLLTLRQKIRDKLSEEKN